MLFDLSLWGFVCFVIYCNVVIFKFILEKLFVFFILELGFLFIFFLREKRIGGFGWG